MTNSMNMWGVKFTVMLNIVTVLVGEQSILLLA